MRKTLARRDFLKAAGTAPLLGAMPLQAQPVQSGSAARKAAPAFVLVQEGRSRHAIYVPADAPAPVAFAAEELQRYIERMSGARLAVQKARQSAGPYVVCIGPAQGPIPGGESISATGTDAFRLVVKEGGIVMAGINPRSTLYAAYELLERLGCRFFLPGEDGEYVPRHATLGLPQADAVSQAAFAARGVTEDSKASGTDEFWRKRVVEDARIFLDWMAKNRMNNYRIGARPSFEAEFAKRGMMPQGGGGHSVPLMLPKELFASKPELFRMDQTGKRVPDGNVCVSNPQTVNLCADVVMQWFRDHPESEYFTVMGQDIWGGAWCSCDRCKPYTASEQNVILINGIHQILRKQGVNGRCAYAAYRDTLRCDLNRVRMDSEVRVGYAPRERSYGHGLADASSERNRWFWNNLMEWRRKHSGPIGITDYYHDSILFYAFAVPTVRVITEDMRAYSKLNVVGTGSYMMGRFSWYSYGPSLYVYGRLSWDPDYDTEHALDELANLHYEPAAEPVRGFWRELELGMSRFASFGEIETLPMTTDPLVEQLMADFNDAIAHMDRAEEHIQRAVAAAPMAPFAARLDMEHRTYRIARMAAEALRHQLHGNYWLAVARRDAERNTVRKQAGRPAGPLRGVGYALERLGAARDYWLKHSALLRELDPEPGSYYIRGPGSGPNGLNQGVISLIELQMNQVKAMGETGTV